MITRRDLAIQYQSVQAGHALAQFCIEHKEIASSWHDNSKYLVYLSVSNERELISFAQKLKLAGLSISIFQEPDIDNQITAIAVEPSTKARKLCSSLPLAMKEFVDNRISKNNFKKEEKYETVIA